MRNLKAVIGLAATATLALSAASVLAQDGEALDISRRRWRTLP